MPRGLEALTIVIDHRDAMIHSSETRTVAGKVTKGSGTALVDGIEHVSQPEHGSTVRQRKSWSADSLMIHREKTKAGTTYVSGIKQTLTTMARF